ncbi:hypothetical protein C823_004541 [Eubacterium plexicaudatum ASF492]|nr:hypothetical protein C823_004541 [Eubacterium plexicaudatum ASF492]
MYWRIWRFNRNLCYNGGYLIDDIRKIYQKEEIDIHETVMFGKNKIRLIYASPFTYLMMLFQISFSVIYIYAYKVTAVSGYFNLLKKDLFLWIIYIPVMVVQHKVSVYSTYYSCISRIGSKRRMILRIMLPWQYLLVYSLVSYYPFRFFY